MAKYEYYNYIGSKRIVQIRPPFERFHKCNAQHSDIKIMRDDNPAVIRFHVKQFISYETKICQIVHDIDHDTYCVYLRGNPFSYSRTTSKQFGRWLKENGFYILADDIRYAINNLNTVTPIIGTYREDNISITMYDDYKAFDRIWR